MITTRRALVLLALTVAVVLGAVIPANAAFTDNTTAFQASVTTVKVQPPTQVKVNSSCVTTTWTTKRVVYTDPVTGAQTTRSTTHTMTSENSRTNVDSTTTSTTPGPGVGETTTTTVDKDTQLYVSATWNRSTSADVTGYQMSAHLGNGYVFTMLSGADTTSMSADADADYLSTSLKATIDTVTRYGWTAQSALSKTLSC
ncbi:hypothetical protein [Geodermatophilus sp. CPCC 206100]|uniref:hypothetical protein n=1 Tax=Geodermatophilus sp. CPCC 206100 TaxID=3020054 RepID=UPI003AFFD2E3